jgi:hypothetical protein
MLGSPTIEFGLRYYTLVRASAARDRGLGEPVPDTIAAQTIAAMMRDHQASRQLRQLYAELIYVFPIAHHTNDQVLRWFQAQLGAGFGGLMLLVRDSRALLFGGKAASEPQDAREARRIDALLRALGDQALHHRGNSYRITRAQANARLAQRATLEVLGDGEARRVLEELAQDQQRDDAQRQVFQELAESFARLRTNPTLQLLVLRHYRSHVLSEGPRETVTPSKLRKQRETHWIELHIEDSEGNALAGVACEVTLSDGSKLAKVSNDLGYVRIDGVSGAGQCAVSLPQLDAKLWRTA